FLSLRLVRNGTTIKFPSKNYYLLWMVETMNGSRSDNNKRVTPGQRRCDGVTSDDNRGWWNVSFDSRIPFGGFICNSCECCGSRCLCLCHVCFGCPVVSCSLFSCPELKLADQRNLS
ncbi:unnamed protein product, partial [Brassica oleracea]